MRDPRPLLVTCFLATTSCGNADATPATSTDAASDGAPLDARRSDGGDEPEKGYGQVGVTAIYTVGKGTMTTVARFVTTATHDTRSCTSTSVGACIFSSCALSEVTIVPDERAAGVVTYTGSAFTGGAFAASFDPKGKRYAWTTFSATPVEGETVTIAATGGDVPAFDVGALRWPSSIELTAPSCSPTCDVEMTKDLSVTWENGTVGTVVVALSLGTAGKTLDTLRCEAPVTARALVVPKEGLAMFATTGVPVQLVVQPREERTLEVNGWRVLASLWNGGGYAQLNLR
jgi:hypothetical protein